MNAAEPNGCRHCGHPQRTHANRWTPSVGWHNHAEPTDAQRLQRMTARRNTTPAATRGTQTEATR